MLETLIGLGGLAFLLWVGVRLLRGLSGSERDPGNAPGAGDAQGSKAHLQARDFEDGDGDGGGGE